MNNAIAVEQSIGSVGLDDLLALVGLPSKRKAATTELSVAANDIFKGTKSFIDGLLLRAISAQTNEEFIAVRKEVLVPYIGAAMSLAKLFKIVVPKQVIAQALNASFIELENEFREQGAFRFGQAAKDQAMFTVWMLRRMSGLVSKITSAPTPDAMKEEEGALARSYAYNALIAQFHLDVLLAAMRLDTPVQLDVLPTVIDGLRAAVDAYGYARQGLNLRIPEPETVMTAPEWDEEDQELLDSSMHDIQMQSID